MTSSGTLERLHPVQQLLADALAALDLVDSGDCGAGPGGGDPGLWSLGSGEVDALVLGVARVVDRLRLHGLDLVGEAVRRGRPAAVGATSPTVWLAGLLHVTPGSARRMVNDAAVLTAAAADPVTTPLVADAREGSLPVDQVVVAATAVAALPAELGGDPERAKAVAFLRAQARVLDPDGLRRAAEHLGEVIDPDGADARLADALNRAERRAHDTRGLHLGPERDGTVRGRFTLPAADAAAVRAALEPLAKPHPTTTTTTTTDESGDTGSAPWPGPDEPPLTSATTLTRDDRTHVQRMADALVELCERSLTHGDLPTTGGERPQLVVLIPLDRLTGTGRAGTGLMGTGRAAAGHTGTGRLLDGTLLSPGQLRRLACDSSVLPAVLGSTSQPLDIGRETRTIPVGLRRALAIRDHGCAFPGCDRPPTWTDAHHIRHWSDGGETSLANLVLLCGHHHRHLHQPERYPDHPGEHGNWTVRIAPDGRPEWTPPTWMHPPGTRIRNTAHP